MRAVLRIPIWPAAVAIALVAPMSAAGSPRALLHRSAPEFVRNDLQHRRIDLGDYRGKAVLLTFWATWCAPCQTEIPEFIEWQRELGLRGFQVMAISMDDNAGPVRQLLRRRQVNYPVVMGDAKLAELYGGVLGLPVTFLIDGNGKVAAVFQGETNLAAMHAKVEGLLRNTIPTDY